MYTQYVDTIEIVKGREHIRYFRSTLKHARNLSELGYADPAEKGLDGHAGLNLRTGNVRMYAGCCNSYVCHLSEIHPGFCEMTPIGFTRAKQFPREANSGLGEFEWQRKNLSDGFTTNVFGTNLAFLTGVDLLGDCNPNESCAPKNWKTKRDPPGGGKPAPYPKEGSEYGGLIASKYFLGPWLLKSGWIADARPAKESGDWNGGLDILGKSQLAGTSKHGTCGIMCGSGLFYTRTGLFNAELCGQCSPCCYYCCQCACCCGAFMIKGREKEFTLAAAPGEKSMHGIPIEY